ncbi:MAG: bifunctional diaminohydroxyphosphoribosylaminopyrimidine deaminase/5-amino-6-(5-phosphoribosylamino)uracil reductase RibD, partial [Armatimonadota bacterium]
MQRAIELAQGGYTAPNPHVGCVIVKGGRIVGEGSSEPAGGSHAEIVALQQAGPLAKGADVYVTLEPCNHTGRTGPCSTALIEAGVSRVAYAVSDPNPVAGGGGAKLTAAGISVSSGLFAEEAERIHAQFLFAHRNQRPLLALKAAMTLDGRVAWPDGRSKWITSEESRTTARLLRAEYG